MVELRFIDGAWRPVLPHPGLGMHSTAHSVGSTVPPSVLGVQSGGSATTLAGASHYSAGSLAPATTLTGSGSLAPHAAHPRLGIARPSPGSPFSLSAGHSSQMSPRPTPGSSGPGSLPGSSPRVSGARQNGGVGQGGSSSGSSGGGGSGGGQRGTEPSTRLPLSSLAPVPEHKRKSSLS